MILIHLSRSFAQICWVRSIKLCLLSMKQKKKKQQMMKVLRIINPLCRMIFSQTAIKNAVLSLFSLFWNFYCDDWFIFDVWFESVKKETRKKKFVWNNGKCEIYLCKNNHVRVVIVSVKWMQFVISEEDVFHKSQNQIGNWSSNFNLISAHSFTKKRRIELRAD